MINFPGILAFIAELASRLLAGILGIYIFKKGLRMLTLLRMIPRIVIALEAILEILKETRDLLQTIHDQQKKLSKPSNN